MTNIETKAKDIPKNKTVLLFSGGMDSLIMNHLLNPDILLVLVSQADQEHLQPAALQLIHL